MIKTIVIIIGLCLTILPAILYFKYLLTHVSKKTKFDYHVDLVNDKKGHLGVTIAYIERISFGVTISTLGVLMSEYFENIAVLKFFLVFVVFYIIIRYIDERLEK